MTDIPTNTRRQRLPQDGDGYAAEGEIRHAVVGLANALCGDTTGNTQDDDPNGCFEFVTQGRQTTWKDKAGKLHTYSACEDLAQAVLAGVAGWQPTPKWGDKLPRSESAWPWVNRAPAWRPGWNLISVKQYAASAWHDASEYKPWNPDTRGGGFGPVPGDVVQVMGSTGPHTFVLLDDHGIVGWTTADYGQFFNGSHGGRVYERLDVRKDTKGRPEVWSWGQRVFRPLIGWVNSVDLVRPSLYEAGNPPSLVADTYVPVV